MSNRVTEVILKLVASVPKSNEHESSTPDARARALARAAARTSAGISGGAALVLGPLGLLSLLPDMVGVWRVQTQMVSDIAAVYGHMHISNSEIQMPMAGQRWDRYKYEFKLFSGTKI